MLSAVAETAVAATGSGGTPMAPAVPSSSMACSGRKIPISPAGPPAIIAADRTGDIPSVSTPTSGVGVSTAGDVGGAPVPFQSKSSRKRKRRKERAAAAAAAAAAMTAAMTAAVAMGTTAAVAAPVTAEANVEVNNGEVGDQKRDENGLSSKKLRVAHDLRDNDVTEAPGRNGSVGGNSQSAGTITVPAMGPTVAAAVSTTAGAVFMDSSEEGGKKLDDNQRKRPRVTDGLRGEGYFTTGNAKAESTSQSSGAVPATAGSIAATVAPAPAGVASVVHRGTDDRNSDESPPRGKKRAVDEDVQGEDDAATLGKSVVKGTSQNAGAATAAAVLSAAGLTASGAASATAGTAVSTVGRKDGGKKMDDNNQRKRQRVDDGFRDEDDIATPGCNNGSVESTCQSAGADPAPPAVATTNIPAVEKWPLICPSAALPQGDLFRPRGFASRGSGMGGDEEERENEPAVEEDYQTARWNGGEAIPIVPPSSSPQFPPVVEPSSSPDAPFDGINRKRKAEEGEEENGEGKAGGSAYSSTPRGPKILRNISCGDISATATAATATAVVAAVAAAAAASEIPENGSARPAVSSCDGRLHLGS